MLRYGRLLFSSLLVLTLLTCALPLRAGDDFVNAAPKPGEPKDLKARKSYASAMDWEKHRALDSAISDYRKANKQEGGKCFQCLSRAYRLAFEMGAMKEAVEIAHEWLPAAENDRERAVVHFMLGRCLVEQGMSSKKSTDLFQQGSQEFNAALQLDPKQAVTHYFLGISLANQMQDDAARAEFQAFLDEDRRMPNLHPRAERFLQRIELARARMAPAFSVTTLDGQRVSMDGLAGRVVLIDFWATWCGPCREALPHVSQIAKKFEGQPFVVLSVSLDTDEAKWKDFVDKNGMTWLQYRDGSFNGSLSKMFNVNAIPATFTIDADGVLEDQHVGDANIEGKLKKLIAQAAAHPAPVQPAGSDN